jgi:hypothetical protein
MEHDLEMLKNLVILSRSKYQIEKFVLGQHDTLPMQFRQIVLEIRSLATSLETAKVSLQILEIKINKLATKNDEISLLKLKKKEIKAGMLSEAIASSAAELEILNEILSSIPFFTEAEIEQNQEEYWEKRLTRQAEIDSIQAAQGISAGNISSLLQAGLISLQNETKVENIVDRELK